VKTRYINRSLWSRLAQRDCKGRLIVGFRTDPRRVKAATIAP